MLGQPVGHLVGQAGGQPLRLLVGARPVQAEGVGQPSLEEPVVADDLRREGLAGLRRRDAAVVRDRDAPALLEALQRGGDGRCAHALPLGDATRTHDLTLVRDVEDRRGSDGWFVAEPAALGGHGADASRTLPSGAEGRAQRRREVLGGRDHVRRRGAVLHEDTQVLELRTIAAAASGAIDPTTGATCSNVDAARATASGEPA